MKADDTAYIQVGQTLTVALQSKWAPEYWPTTPGKHDFHEATFHSLAPSRKAEFQQVRALARVVLAKAGHSGSERYPFSLNGRPIWPQGFCGSISHSSKHVAVAVQKRLHEWQGLGIDIEEIDDVSPHEQALAPAFSEWERAWLANHPLGLLSGFSGKESVLKCFSPIVRRFINFQDLELLPSASGDDRLFGYRILDPDLQAILPREGLIYGRLLEGANRVLLTATYFPTC